MTHARPLLLAALASAALAACSASPDPEPTPPAGQAVTVRVSPDAAAVPANGSAQFLAAVTGTATTGVAWTVVEATGGTVSGGGLYSAPGSGGTFHVRATSLAASSVFGEATVTVRPPVAVAVAVTPSTGAVDACRTLALAATVTNATNGAVTWRVVEGAAGGAVASNGVYTAPSAGGVYHVVATSVEDPSKSATAQVTVADKVLSVAVSPATTTVAASGTVQLTATVTTTCGAFVTAATVGP
jgi:hypothetical protein